MTCDQFTTQYLDCHFDETKFPTPGGEKYEITKNGITPSFLEPKTSESEYEFQRITHLQNLSK